MSFGSAEWLALGEIIWINALLSGDNAVVVAMACRSLPPGQRRIGMALGAGAAIALRVVFTVVIATVLGVPYLKALGALALAWIAIDLVRPKGENGQKVAAHAGLIRAIATIAGADVVMSLDNVIAIAGVAGDHYGLLIIGLVISIPMIVAGSALILAVMDRVPLVVWLGAALLGFVAGQMFVSDVAFAAWFGPGFAERWMRVAEFAFAFAVVAVGFLIAQSCKAERPDALSE